MKIEYIAGTTETVELCEDCRESFIDAELVADVVLPESEGHSEAED